MTEPLTAAVIVSLFFFEAIKESGKALNKGVTDTFAQLVNTFHEKFNSLATYPTARIERGGTGNYIPS